MTRLCDSCGVNEGIHKSLGGLIYCKKCADEAGLVYRDKIMTTINVVIVGFKVKEENSVYYKKLKGMILGVRDDDSKLLGAFKKALRASDFISVRVVRGKDNEKRELVEGEKR